MKRKTAVAMRCYRIRDGILSDLPPSIEAGEVTEVTECADGWLVDLDQGCISVGHERMAQTLRAHAKARPSDLVGGYLAYRPPHVYWMDATTFARSYVEIREEDPPRSPLHDDREIPPGPGEDDGMTMRDRFAMAAIPWTARAHGEPDNAARAAYRLADAMIAARTELF